MAWYWLGMPELRPIPKSANIAQPTLALPVKRGNGYFFAFAVTVSPTRSLTLNTIFAAF
jgi:hypothetical protein